MMFSTAARSLSIVSPSRARASAYSDRLCTIDTDTNGEASALHVEGSIEHVRAWLQAQLDALQQAEAGLATRSYANGEA